MVNYAQQENPYSNTYKHILRNFPNISYKNNPPSVCRKSCSSRCPTQISITNCAPLKSNLEMLMENFVMTQTWKNKYFKNYNLHTTQVLRGLASKDDPMATHNKMLEKNKFISKRLHFPRQNFSVQPEQNPKWKINVVTLQSSKELEPTVKKSDKGRWLLLRNKKQPYVASPSYKHVMLFIQRFVRMKIKEKFRKFVELLKKIHINIPFTEALPQVPSYAKFLK